MKRSLMRDFIEKALSDCGGDSKKTWKVIKNLWPGKTKSTNITKIGETSAPQDIANALNLHFSTAGKKICNQTTSSMTHVRTFNDNTELPQLTEIKIEDIYEILKCLSPAKATGTDDIPT